MKRYDMGFARRGDVAGFVLYWEYRRGNRLLWMYKLPAAVWKHVTPPQFLARADNTSACLLACATSCHSNLWRAENLRDVV
jgi:hypothetical protein